MAGTETLVEVGGHRLKLTNLDKVLYPETGTTKAEVLDYYSRVADVPDPARARPRRDPQALAQRRRTRARPDVLREAAAVARAELDQGAARSSTATARRRIR